MNADNPFQMIPLKNIAPGNNPRDDWENQEIEGLASSVKATHGLLQPLVVRPDPDAAGKFRIVCGERRYRAAKKANRASVECIVRDVQGAAALELALQENLNRKNLNPMQIARVLEELCKPVAEGGAGYRNAQCAARFGKTSSWAKNVRRLVKLPERFQRKIASGELPQSIGWAIVPYVDDAEFLAKLESDMAANPWAYRTRKDFCRSVELLKEGGAGSTPSPIKRALPAAVDQEPQRSPAAAAQPAASEARPIEPDAGSRPTLADRAVALIDGMQTLEQLNQVQRALNKQRQHIHQVNSNRSKAERELTPARQLKRLEGISASR